MQPDIITSRAWRNFGVGLLQILVLASVFRTVVLETSRHSIGLQLTFVFISTSATLAILRFESLQTLRASFTTFGVNKQDFIVLSLCLLSIMLGIWVIVQQIVGKISMPMGPLTSGYWGPRRVPPGYYEAVACYVLFTAPVIEEMSFRGWMQSGLTERFGSVIGIVTPAVLFAALHGSTYSHPVYLLIPLSLACTLGIVRHRIGSIWPGVVLHSLWNLCIIGASIGLFTQPEFHTSMFKTVVVTAAGSLLGATLMVAVLTNRGSAIASREKPAA